MEFVRVDNDSFAAIQEERILKDIKSEVQDKVAKKYRSQDIVFSNITDQSPVPIEEVIYTKIEW